MRPAAGIRDTEITIQSRTGTQDASYGTWSYTWADLATEWAEVQDMLGSERMAEGLNLSNRPCRIRMLYRDDVTSAMRVKIGDRILQIVRGPIELGRKDGLQMVCEEYSTAGDEA